MTQISKNILLGVTGGIAAYKSAELVRLLRKAEFEVRVVMTPVAEQFVTALTFQALSGHVVLREGEHAESEFAMDHIAAARWADMVLVAPATADFMAKLVQGFANDLLSSLCLATTAPVVLAPAMNQQMWLNAATQANKNTLLARDILLWGPDAGSQACGEVGAGRMVEPQELLQNVQLFFAEKIFAGLRILVSAGPTQEAIDPVRYISNRSSGKMGYAFAEAAQKLGAEVVLISGPTSLDSPAGVKRISVVTAEEMQNAVMENLASCAMFISAAAVADYRCKNPAPHKIKKQAENISLELTRNADILSMAANSKNRPFIVGFAAETENILENARKKLVEKKLDVVIANDVSQNDRGFDADQNAVTVVWKDGEQEFALQPKKKLALEVLQSFAGILAHQCE